MKNFAVKDFVVKHPVARIFAAAFVALIAGPAMAGETKVAVAANFTEPATEIAKLFAEKTGHTAVLAFGATGQFYTQITQGAPFEVFLAADNIRPTKAVADGFGVPGTVFTYAEGQLVLWSPKGEAGAEALKGDFQHLAIANPEAAPYGLAAVQTLKSLGLYDRLEPRIVQGANISQALQFVETGNAEMGFVALSQVVGKGGGQWVVPAAGHHDPILQDAVLLKVGAENEAAKAFLAFLRGPEAAKVIRAFGYTIPAATN